MIERLAQSLTIIEKNYEKCYIYIINYQNRRPWYDLLRNDKETEA